MKKHLSVITLLLAFPVLFSACGKSEVSSFDQSKLPDYPVVAQIDINGEKIEDFRYDKYDYDVDISNDVFTQPEIQVSVTAESENNFEIISPDTIEGTYEVKFGDDTYKIDINYDSQTAELGNTYYKLKNDKKLNIAYFGGSVTAGYGSSSNEKCYASLVTKHLQERFPQADISMLNASIGGTGTEFGVYRAQKDLQLETFKPDLVFIEFAVNDLIDKTPSSNAKSNMETIIQTIYSYSPETDIVMIFITGASYKGKSFAQLEAHREIASAYSIPCLDVGAAICTDIGKQCDINYINEKSPEWLKYFIDSVHPNDLGYEAYAKYINDYLDRVLSEERTVPSKVIKAFVPEKPITNLVQNPQIFNASNYSGSSVGGFTVTKDGYLKSDSSGNHLTLKFTGKTLKLWCYAFPNGGAIEYTIDGGAVQKLDLTKSSSNHIVFPLATGLENKEHTVKLKTVAGNSGNKIDIRYFLIESNEKNGAYSVSD